MQNDEVNSEMRRMSRTHDLAFRSRFLQPICRQKKWIRSFMLTEGLDVIIDVWKYSFYVYSFFITCKVNL